MFLNGLLHAISLFIQYPSRSRFVKYSWLLNTYRGFWTWMEYVFAIVSCVLCFSTWLLQYRLPKKKKKRKVKGKWYIFLANIVYYIVAYHLLIVRVLQGLESDVMRDQLAIVAESLNKVRSMIYPSADKASKLVEILPGLGEAADKEHKRILARKSLIEKRKEEHERHLIEMVFPSICSWNLMPSTFMYLRLPIEKCALILCLLGTWGGVKEAKAAKG